MKPIQLDIINTLEIVEYSYFVGPMPTCYNNKEWILKFIQEEIADRMQSGIRLMKPLETHVINKTFRIHFRNVV